MPRTAQFAIRRGHARGFSWNRFRRVWHERLAGFARRVRAGTGFALASASLLLLLTLLTYSRSDASLDTASAASPANYVGRGGAIVADILMQSVGLAAYLLPAVLLGWAFRLLLQRPVHRPVRRCLLLLPTFFFGAFACSILHPALALPAGSGGALGWLALAFVRRVGLAAAALPLAMAAAALLAWLLLAIIGLSPGDWRELGQGAGRVARLSGHGTAAAAGIAGRLFLAWRERRAADRRAAASGALVRPPPPDGRPAPQFAAAAAAPAPDPMPADAPAAGRFVRLVMPRPKQPPAGRRADAEAQPALD